MAENILADILIKSGRASEALEQLPDMSKDTPLQRVLNDLRRTEALLILQARTEADHAVRDAIKFINNYGFVHMKPHAEFLAARL